MNYLGCFLNFLRVILIYMEIEGIELKVFIVNVLVLFFYRLVLFSIWIGRDEEEFKNFFK